jgi:very-short-patch-repair endonuclease
MTHPLDRSIASAKEMRKNLTPPEARQRDDRRDLWLERHGITVLRIEARHVRDTLEAVLTEIGRAAGEAVRTQ